MCTNKITATRGTAIRLRAPTGEDIYMELFTFAHSRQSELPRMPLHACVFHSLCRRPSARSRIVPQRPSARSQIVLAKRPSARSRIVLPQASICEVADSACGLTLCDCQILLIIFFDNFVWIAADNFLCMQATSIAWPTNEPRRNHPT